MNSKNTLYTLVAAGHTKVATGPRWRPGPQWAGERAYFHEPAVDAAAFGRPSPMDVGPKTPQGRWEALQESGAVPPTPRPGEELSLHNIVNDPATVGGYTPGEAALYESRPSPARRLNPTTPPPPSHDMAPAPAAGGVGPMGKTLATGAAIGAGKALYDKATERPKTKLEQFRDWLGGQ